MALSPAEKVRQLLGEVGDASSTLFTDEEIAGFLEEGNDDVNKAAYEGWRAKAAQLSNLVDVTEGNASRAMSDAYAHALEMVKLYSPSSGVLAVSSARTRIGKIRRR